MDKIVVGKIATITNHLLPYHNQVEFDPTQAIWSLTNYICIATPILQHEFHISLFMEVMSSSSKRAF